MDAELRELLLLKGLTEEHVEGIKSADSSLKTVGDLASGAVSEEDARSWAEELGLNTRVGKSRFIQSWIEAREREQREKHAQDSPIGKGDVRLAEAPEDHPHSPQSIQGMGASAQESKAAEAARGLLPGLRGESPPPLSPPTWDGRQDLADFRNQLREQAEQKGAELVSKQEAQRADGMPYQVICKRVPICKQPSSLAPAIGYVNSGEYLILYDYDKTKKWRLLHYQSAGGYGDLVKAWVQVVHSDLGVCLEPAVSDKILQKTRFLAGTHNRPIDFEKTPPAPAASDIGVAEPYYPLTANEKLKRRLMEEPVPLADETFSTPGGLSDTLKRVLKASGLTSTEVNALEKTLGCRTCRDLAIEVDTKEAAMRLAREAGINSKVSQENFAASWYECAATHVALSVPGGSDQAAPGEYPLFAMVARGDFDACAQFLKKQGNMQDKQELIPLLSGLLCHIAERQRVKEVAPKPTPINKVLPVLAAYGEQVAARVARRHEAEEAEWRWRWTVRALFSPRTAVALQKRVLDRYQSHSFQAVCREQSKLWETMDPPLELEKKMSAIEDICMEHVLSQVLPSFGFSPDSTGVQEMKAAVKQHTQTHPEVRKLQLDCTAAIMHNFKI